jgi:1-phosphofructokinase
MVFAPSPLLTVTIEARGGSPDIHLHAGGQGFWIARMVGALGVPVVLCGSFGGESGAVVRTLVESEHVAVRGVRADAANGAYVHDRRTGERVAIAEVASAPLSRHDVDELYAVSVVEGLESEVCVLGGPTAPDVIPPDTYRRLASDLRTSGRTVVADLSGEPLRAALEGGVTVLKVSHEELVTDGLAESDSTEHLVAAMLAAREAGAERVVVSRADRPALATDGDRILELSAPRLEPVDVRGAGDSMTAGIAAALARGDGWEDALRLGIAGGSLNVTRRGLATGRRREIERLAGHVDLRPLGQADGIETATPEDLAGRARPA